MELNWGFELFTQVLPFALVSGFAPVANGAEDARLILSGSSRGPKFVAPLPHAELL